MARRTDKYFKEAGLISNVIKNLIKILRSVYCEIDQIQIAENVKPNLNLIISRNLIS